VIRVPSRSPSLALSGQRPHWHATGCRDSFRRVERRLGFWEAMSAFFVLGIAGGVIAWALLSWLIDQEMRAGLLTGCGAVLAVWSIFRLSPTSSQA